MSIIDIRKRIAEKLAADRQEIPCRNCGDITLRKDLSGGLCPKCFSAYCSGGSAALENLRSTP